MLLRIYYVKDFPPHTLLLEIRKGYFMEPETNLPRGKKKNDFEKEEGIKKRWNFAVSSRQQTIKERSQGGWEDL